MSSYRTIKMVNNEQIFSPEQQKTRFHLNSSSASCRNVRAEASLSSKCHGVVSCVMDVRPGCPPPPPPDGRHLAVRAEETDEGITHHLLITLLQSGNKAAAASAAVSALFHFLCGRKLSQHTADRHRPYPANHLSGFIEGEADCQSRSSTCSQRAQ